MRWLILVSAVNVSYYLTTYTDDESDKLNTYFIRAESYFDNMVLLLNAHYAYVSVCSKLDMHITFRARVTIYLSLFMPLKRQGHSSLLVAELCLSLNTFEGHKKSLNRTN